MSKNRLTKLYEEVDIKTLEDALTVIVSNIESSLLAHGAEPEKDYTYMDLYKLAMEYLTAIKKDPECKIATNFILG